MVIIPSRRTTIIPSPFCVLAPPPPVGVRLGVIVVGVVVVVDVGNTVVDGVVSCIR